MHLLPVGEEMECTELRGDEQGFELSQWKELIFGIKGECRVPLLPRKAGREALCTWPFIYQTLKVEDYPSGLQDCRSSSQALLLLIVQNLKVVLLPLFL